jgi:hypothetical protein
VGRCTHNVGDEAEGLCAVFHEELHHKAQVAA